MAEQKAVKNEAWNIALTYRAVMAELANTLENDSNSSSIIHVEDEHNQTEDL